MPKGVPQIMDITSIKSILHYLSVEILPSKFEKAQQPESNTIQLCFRGLNDLNWIEVSWQGDCARILSIKKPEKAPDSIITKSPSKGDDEKVKNQYESKLEEFEATYADKIEGAGNTKWKSNELVTIVEKKNKSLND